LHYQVWDLSDYGVLSETSVQAEQGGEGGVSSVCWVKDSAIVSGWKDRAIRAFDASNMKPLWEIANAHKASVTAVKEEKYDLLGLVI
jgi:WD40 repeat protein